MRLHLNKLFFLLFLGLSIVSCKKEKTDRNEIKLDEIVLNLNKDAQTQMIEVPISEKSNEWHLYSPSKDGWVTQEIIPGKSAIYIHIDGNTAAEARSSYIMIRSKNYTQKIVINQDIDGGIILSQAYVPVRYLSSSAEVTITNLAELTNLQVQVEEGTQAWLTAQLTNDKVKLDVALNQLTAARTSLVTVTAKRKISGETVTAFINLYQGRGGLTPYIIELPDFSESFVYKVMDGSKQVAQITKEYLRSSGRINAQAIVIYPVENDIVAISKGFVAQIVLENTSLTDATYTYTTPTGAVHGGNVSFSISTNTISGYTAGTSATPITKVYMPGDVGMGAEEIPGSKVTTLVAQTIVDVRGNETNIYPVVKIGAQYWMGKNLNTAFYNKNKNFVAIPTNKTSEPDRLAGNYSIYNYVNGAATDALAIVNRTRYGLLYSYLTVGGFDTPQSAGLSLDGNDIVDNLSPDGWIVPTYTEANAMRNYIGYTGKLRKFLTYANDNAITGDQYFIEPTRTDDNVTLFAAPNGSYRSTNGTFYGLNQTNGAWFWTRTFAAVGTSNSSVAGKAFHTTGLQASQPAMREFSIRSISTTAIKTSDQ